MKNIESAKIKDRNWWNTLIVIMLIYTTDWPLWQDSLWWMLSVTANSALGSVKEVAKISVMTDCIESLKIIAEYFAIWVMKKLDGLGFLVK